MGKGVTLTKEELGKCAIKGSAKWNESVSLPMGIIGGDIPKSKYDNYYYWENKA
jgi:hypothetical protein